MSTATHDQLYISTQEEPTALLNDSTEEPTATTHKQGGRRAGSVHVCQCRPVYNPELHARCRHLFQQDVPAAQTVVSKQKGLSNEHCA